MQCLSENCSVQNFSYGHSEFREMVANGRFYMYVLGLELFRTGFHKYGCFRGEVIHEIRHSEEVWVCHFRVMLL